MLLNDENSVPGKGRAVFIMPGTLFSSFKIICNST